MKNHKLTIIAVIGIIFSSYCGFVIGGRISQTFEERRFSFSIEGDIGDILPEWIQEGYLPLVPAIIIFSGLLLFIIFSLDLYWKKQGRF